MPKNVVYSFNLGDVDDVSIHAALPIYKWEHSASGQWVMLNSNIIPIWNVCPDYNGYGFRVYVIADLTDEHWTYFQLKYGQLTNEHI